MRISQRSQAALAIGLTLALLLTGCNLPSAVPTLLPTYTALAPQDTPTLPPPTDTPPPTVSPTATAENIVFAAGATAGVKQGTLQPGEVRSFTVSAGQYQPMILIADSPYHDLTLAVYEANGHMLLDPANHWNNWQWLLPATEVYTIQVIGGGSVENFTLTVKIAARVALSSTSTGTATVSGSTPNGYVISYAVTGHTGQTLHVSLTAPANSAVIDVFGLAYGQVLVATSANATNWSGTLPANQDYIVEIVPNPGQIINYSLKVTLN